MIFHQLDLPGAYLLEPERIEDNRGFFARTYSREEFESRGLLARLEQCNVSYNRLRGTLRGMHWQQSPYQEVKLVRCTRGAIFDCMVDIRRESPTYGRWYGAELSEDNRSMLYIPHGFAHGFLTLTDDAEVFYQMSQVYHAPSARGFRWNDPAVAIAWPGEVRVISDRDAGLPRLEI